MKQFTLNVNSAVKPLEKYWELCVGSCHATTALREDYRKQLEQCQREIGFRYVRFHGLFDDDMSVVVQDNYSKEMRLSFINIDSIFDFLLSINMKPFVELGFMPECLKSKPATIFHYKGNTAPPADHDQWAWFIRTFMQHLLDRYGRTEVRQWFFEVWNEPNLGGPDSPDGFFAGSMEDYFKLYRVTAEAVKAVDPCLRVGGPATSNNAWIPEMVKFCRENQVPIDFISTHHYPTDVVLGYGVEDSANFGRPTPEQMEDPEYMKTYKEKLEAFHAHLWERVDRGVVTRMTQKAFQEADGIPLYYTEWNSLAGLPSDGPFGASFIAKTVLDGVGMAKGYSYWTFSDIFEENGMPSAEFHGGFGLLTLHGVPKATYRAFQLLHTLGDVLYEQKLADGTLDVYAVKHAPAGALQFLVVNHHSLLHPIAEEEVRITLKDLEAPVDTVLKAQVERIDDNHANAIACWRELGSPEYVTKAQLEALKSASEMERELLEIPVAQKGASVTVKVPAMGVALLTVYLP